MKSVKIIHTGDMHFDSPWSGLPSDIAAVRKEEQLLTFSKIIDEAASADLLLICGDMLDGFSVSMQTLSHIKKCFERIPDTHIFITPGNHDYLCDSSPYSYFDFGKNVHIFNSKLSCVELDHVRVYGVGFAERYVKEPLLQDFRAINDDKISIMLIHGELADSSDYNPIRVRDIEDSGLHYLAVGHYHKHDGVKKAGKTSYCYCGIPEGRSFDETGDCGYIYAEIFPTESEIRFIPAAKRINRTINVDIIGCNTYDDVLSKIHINKNDLYKITLSGNQNPNIQFDSKVLEELTEAFYCKIVNLAKPSLKDSDNFGLIGKYFIEYIESSDIIDKDTAIKIGLEALSGGGLH